MLLTVNLGCVLLSLFACRQLSDLVNYYFDFGSRDSDFLGDLHVSLRVTEGAVLVEVNISTWLSELAA